MMTTKRLKIRLEKHELKVVRISRCLKLYCEICKTEIPHLTVSQMSAVLGISELKIFRLVERGNFHSNETADGKLMICKESRLSKL